MTIVMIICIIFNCRGNFAQNGILANVLILPLLASAIIRSNNKYVRMLFGLK